MWHRLALAGQVFWSPDIVTFMDARRFTFLTARVEYEILQQAAVYAGYRKIRAALENGPDAKVESGPHIGVRLEF